MIDNKLIHIIIIIARTNILHRILVEIYMLHLDSISRLFLLYDSYDVYRSLNI